MGIPNLAARLTRVATEAAARRALGSASGDAKRIDEHRTSFRAAEAGAQERIEEEDALEQWTAGHFPARRS